MTMVLVSIHVDPAGSKIIHQKVKFLYTLTAWLGRLYIFRPSCMFHKHSIDIYTTDHIIVMRTHNYIELSAPRST